MSAPQRDIRVHEIATEDEIAAVMAAIEGFLAAEEPAPARPLSRWTRRGRLEAQGIAPTTRALLRRWSID